MLITTQAIEKQLPYYLTQGKKEALTQAIRDFPNCNYYVSGLDKDLLQGDGWNSVEVVSFQNGERAKIHGIMLSNSCDVDEKNNRDRSPLITFAPLISKNSFVDLLKKIGKSANQIQTKLNAIENQEITSIFYLPKGGMLEQAHLALLDDLHTIPLQHFKQTSERTKLFTFSQVGFYIFIMKVSIHFCRMQEEIDRG
jgi:hypothetical protein